MWSVQKKHNRKCAIMSWMSYFDLKTDLAKILIPNKILMRSLQSLQPLNVMTQSKYCRLTYMYEE